MIIFVLVDNRRMRGTFYRNVTKCSESKITVENFKKLRLKTLIDIKEILKRMKSEELSIIIKYISNCKLII